MDVMDSIRNRLRGLNSEDALLMLFMTVAAFMFVRANEWNYEARVFPRMMAAIVIVGCVLLLVRNYLPGPLRAIVVGEVSAFQGSEELEEDIEREESDEGLGPDYNRPLNPALATAILIVAYVATGYLFSLLLMSPLFVAAYLIWFRQPWPIVVFLSLLALAVGYVFAEVIIVPVDRGMLVGELLMIGGVL